MEVKTRQELREEALMAFRSPGMEAELQDEHNRDLTFGSNIDVSVSCTRHFPTQYPNSDELRW